MLVSLCMAILWILGIGAVVVIWMAMNLSKTPAKQNSRISFSENPPKTPAWRKDRSDVFATDGLDYVQKLERHQNDPRHWPFPIQPPAAGKNDSEFD